MMNISKIKINYITYIYVFLFLFSGYKNNVFIVFLIFFTHELGHLFFCYLFKVTVTKVEIYPFGGIIKLNNYINYSILKSILISSGGLIFQILLEVINLFIIKSDMLAYYNYLIFCINILPIIPFDGSRIFQLFMSFFISFYKSKILSYIVSIFFLSLISLNLILKGRSNYIFVIFCLTFTIKEIKELSHLFNRFLLERYLYNLNYKNIKKHRYLNLKLLCINHLGFFYENGWNDEKYYLRKIFDK